MAKKNKPKKKSGITVQQFNFGLGVATGMFKVEDGKVIVPDFIKIFGIKAKFPIPIPDQKPKKK